MEFSHPSDRVRSAVIEAPGGPFYVVKVPQGSQPVAVTGSMPDRRRARYELTN